MSITIITILRLASNEIYKSSMYISTQFAKYIQNIKWINKKCSIMKSPSILNVGVVVFCKLVVVTNVVSLSVFILPRYYRVCNEKQNSNHKIHYIKSRPTAQECRFPGKCEAI